jgi:hypothetical protein
LRYFEGGVLLDPLGDDAGGHGASEGLVPGLACDVPESLPELPGVVGDEPAFDDPGFAALGVPVGPGSGPQGEPLGVVPGLFGVFGFIVDGCVLLPGVGLPGEFEPGTAPGVVFLGAVPLVELAPGAFGFCGACGVAVLAGGVVVPAGGVAVFAGGVAVPGVELWPAEPELLTGGAPPAGALCATSQDPQRRTTDNHANFLADVLRPPENDSDP